MEQSDVIYVEKTSFLLTEGGYEDKWRVAPTNDVDLKANKIMILLNRKLSNCWNYNFKTDR